jgi:O-antigen/teichoic acid export membrane protein
LAWIVIGYFSLFDLGIGRALTKLVADKLGAHQEHDIPPLAWTSLLLMLVLGGIGCLVLTGTAPWLVQSLKVPVELQAETLPSLYLLGASIPIVTVTSGLRGILEAQQRFYVLNFIRVPTSIFSYAGPLLVLPFSHSLISVVLVLFFGRLIGGAAHLVACFHTMPALRGNFVLQRVLILPLVRFGGWMTVSNIVGPLMVYVDRFLIGGLLSLAAVTYYTVPFDVLTRLSVIPASVTAVLFPAFAVSLIQDRERTALLVSRGIKYIFLAMFPIILITVTFAPEGLQLWLGSAFSHNSELVMRVLAAGVFINAIAYVPFVLIQGAGRPDITAKLHLLELPLYLGSLWQLTKRLGIEGSAVAWTGRITLDAVLLFFLAHRLLPHKHRLVPNLVATTAAGLLVLYLATIPRGLLMKGAFVVSALLVFGIVSWFWALEPEERRLMFRVRNRPAEIQNIPVR